jgi:RNA polymerase sigma factor (TIGR02999 family)
MVSDEASRADITRFLIEASEGNTEASELVWSSLYSELRRLARIKLNGERGEHTLSTTALVHEAFVKLVDGSAVAAADRHHFLALAARAMRQILVDHARHRTREKRGGAHVHLSLDEARDRPMDPARDPHLLLALDEALTRLTAASPRLANVVELRFFGGLGAGETAELLGVARRTVERDWQRARAYLYRLLAEEAGAMPT